VAGVQILDAVIDTISDGSTVSLDSAARAAGLTKPGVMYHFPNKEALMVALTDRIIDQYESRLHELLPEGTTLETASEQMRLHAYLTCAFTDDTNRGHLVLFVDPRQRQRMVDRWSERFRPWIEISDDVTPEVRARLTCVRLIAEGAWFTQSTGILPLNSAQHHQTLEAALQMLEGAER
jgi:AcrR family transcriptional regulator